MLTVVGNLSAMYRCPKCSVVLPLRWSLFSAAWTKCRCVSCGSLIEWTNRRRLVGGICGGLGAIAGIELQPLVPSLFLRGMIISLIVITAVIFIPGQFRLVREDRDIWS